MKNKNKKIETEEQKEIKKFIFVILGLVIILVGIYFFTRAFVTKDLFNTSEKTYQEGTINYDIAIVGNMLTRPNKEYYVMAFHSDNADAIYYNALIGKYMQKEKAEKVYYIDLDNALNKKYVAEKEEEKSTSFKTIKDLKLGELTLLKVKEGKVTKYITNIEEIKKELDI